MKNIGIVIVMLLVVFACKKEEKATYKTFGETMEASNFISKEEMKEKFEGMKAGDTLDVRFASNINSVCKAKGCWMKLDLGEEKESMVKFKDYGFFVPLNSDNRDVIVNGKAYVTEVSVEELQHFAKDAGKSDQEIALIIEPEFTYAFLADGVLMEDETTSNE
jgi:hypothetical protein